MRSRGEKPRDGLSHYSGLLANEDKKGPSKCSALATRSLNAPNMCVQVTTFYISWDKNICVADLISRSCVCRESLGA